MADKLIITNNIRRLRFFANEMTQLELAEKAGKYILSLEIAFKIANIICVGIGEVFECIKEEKQK